MTHITERESIFTGRRGSKEKKIMQNEKKIVRYFDD
jgi:hypothetical protein